MGLGLFYAAFWELNSCRSQGYAEGPIGWLTMHEYCVVNEIEGEQREDLFYFVQKMDSAYLDYRVKQIEKQTKK